MGSPPRKARRGGGRGRRRRLRRLRHLLRRAVPLLLVTGLLASTVSFLWIDRVVVGRFRERTTTFPSRVYAAPWTFRLGDRLDPIALEEQLGRLGYRPVEREPRRPGEYRRQGNRWTLFLHEADTELGKRRAFPVEVGGWWGKVRRIRDRETGTHLRSLSLEPEPLFTFYAALQEKRQWAPLEEIPPLLRQAVVTVEDRRFLRHHGIDPAGIARALMADLRAGKVVQGGSTITQQLVKNLLGPGRRRPLRKLLEAAGAIALELHLDKEAIFAAYLNEVYLGQQGPVAISGVGEASRFYFGKNLQDLDLPESALLAGMIRNPGRYNPWRFAQRARDRRDLVLTLMHQLGQIDEAALHMAQIADLGVPPRPPLPGRFPWLHDFLAQEISEIAPEALPSRAGFSIFTTFDPRVQRAARKALQSGLSRLEARLGPREGQPLEGAVVVLRPEDGALLALVGGRDYRRSQFHRAIDSRRSPGSTFKPLVFVAAFERALVEPEFAFTPATLLEDAPLEIDSGGRTWSPANYDDTFRGEVTAREALESSINVPTVRAALQVGLPAVVDAARRCGIQSHLDAIPSLALGTEEVSPLEMAGAYAPFANGGWRIQPHGLAAVTDRAGDPLTDLSFPRVRVLAPNLAYLVTNLLEGVMERGTGRSAARLGFPGHAAGKTGSSDGLRDAWFVGYTPDLLSLVWVGYDDNRPVGVPGAVGALPIWVDLMDRLGVQGAEPFSSPRGLVWVAIDPTTGQRAVGACREVMREIFLAGTEPQEQCELHGGKRRRPPWWRLFGRDH